MDFWRYLGLLCPSCSFCIYYETIILIKEEEEEEEKWPEVFVDGGIGRTRAVRHPRRYGLQAMPHLMAGMGLWALPYPQAHLAQVINIFLCSNQFHGEKLFRVVVID